MLRGHEERYGRSSRRSGWDTKELPYATGETSSQQHQTDVFRENFDRIDWNGGKVEAAPDVQPEIKARHKFVDNYDNIKWSQ